jgi:hypothetical protein
VAGMHKIEEEVVKIVLCIIQVWACVLRLRVLVGVRSRTSSVGSGVLG